MNAYLISCIIYAKIIRGLKKMRRVLVSIPRWSLEKYEERDSEIIKNIVLAYLSEKGYLKDRPDISILNCLEKIHLSLTIYP